MAFVSCIFCFFPSCYAITLLISSDFGSKVIRPFEIEKHTQQFIVDRVGWRSREIMCLVASVCPLVCPFWLSCLNDLTYDLDIRYLTAELFDQGMTWDTHNEGLIQEMC